MLQRDPSVAISQERYQKVSEEAKLRGISVKRHFNNIIDYYTKRRDMINDYSDSLQYVGIAANLFVLYDTSCFSSSNKLEVWKHQVNSFRSNNCCF